MHSLYSVINSKNLHTTKSEIIFYSCRFQCVFTHEGCKYTVGFARMFVTRVGLPRMYMRAPLVGSVKSIKLYFVVVIDLQLNYTIEEVPVVFHIYFYKTLPMVVLNIAVGFA